MNTNSVDLHRLLAFGLGDEDWQQFVDHYEEKYDAVQIDGFVKVPMKLNYTFSQLISSTGATTLPAYVDPESPGYEKSLKSLSGKTGNIPTQKAFYRLNRVIMQEKLQLVQQFGDAALDGDMLDCLLGLFDESTEGLIKGYHNSLTHQRMRIASTGKFTIDIDNNPRGLNGIEISFGVPDSHYLANANGKRWWTTAEHVEANEGADSDPIQDIKDTVKKIRRTFHVIAPMHVEMAEDLMQDLLSHSKVLKRIAQSAWATVESEATLLANVRNQSDDWIKARFQQLCGINIVTRDSIAYVDKPGENADGEKDLVQVAVENFKATNISFLPDGNWGTIQGVKPLTLGYEPQYVAEHDGGRLILSQRANPETHSIYIESEAAQLCVPGQPQNMFYYTVTA